MAMDKQAEEWEPSHWDELFPGRFLKNAHLCGREVEIRINRVYNTVIDDKLAQVAAIEPVDGIKQRDFGLNKTNGLCLRAMFGDTIKDWWGKRVLIKPSVVEHGREKGKPCIRVCGSPDIAEDRKVVIDFHTKRIKPFVITVRSTAKSAPAQAQAKPPSTKAAASPDAVRLSAEYRAATTAAALNDVAMDVEEALAKDSITKDEATQLMGGITKKEAALKESSNVIT